MAAVNTDHIFKALLAGLDRLLNNIGLLERVKNELKIPPVVGVNERSCSTKKTLARNTGKRIFGWGSDHGHKIKRNKKNPQQNLSEGDVEEV